MEKATYTLGTTLGTISFPLLLGLPQWYRWGRAGVEPSAHRKLLAEVNGVVTGSVGSTSWSKLQTNCPQDVRAHHRAVAHEVCK